jgi:formyltetrahydrofolate hydrolase
MLPSPSREQLELLEGNVDLVVLARAVTAFREDRILRDGNTTVVF